MSKDPMAKWPAPAKKKSGGKEAQKAAEKFWKAADQWETHKKQFDGLLKKFDEAKEKGDDYVDYFKSRVKLGEEELKKAREMDDPPRIRKWEEFTKEVKGWAEEHQRRRDKALKEINEELAETFHKMNKAEDQIKEAKKEVAKTNEDVRKIVEKEEKEELEKLQEALEKQRQEEKERKPRRKTPEDEDF